MFFESEGYTPKFFMTLLLGLMTCVLAFFGISKEEALQPRNKNVMKIIAAIFIWVIASLFLLTFCAMFSELMVSELAKTRVMTPNIVNNISLTALSWTLMFIAFGISVLRYRKSNYMLNGESDRITLTFIMPYVLYRLQGAIISGLDELNVLTYILFALVIVIVIILRRGKIVKEQ